SARADRARRPPRIRMRVVGRASLPRGVLALERARALSRGRIAAHDADTARVAERIATLDVLSGGRVEFGTGEGSAAAELDAFGVQPVDKRAMWEEGVRVALRCLTETPFT